MLFQKKLQNNSAINVPSMVDFTLLDPRATNSDLEKICDIAYKNEYYAVCVASGNVGFVSAYNTKYFSNKLKIVSVIGFPFGNSSTQLKISEAKEAIENGADEIDMVINIGKAKSGYYDYLKKEIEKIRKVSKRKILKVILETCYFDENEIVKLVKICIACKVDFVKTSTGFGTGGAKKEVVSLIKKIVGNKCKIKASGGIKTREQVVEFLNLGADRIGTSSII